MTRLCDFFPPRINPPARNHDNEKEREQIARDVARYLARGGKIKQIPPGETGQPFLMDRTLKEIQTGIKEMTWAAAKEKAGSK